MNEIRLNGRFVLVALAVVALAVATAQLLPGLIETRSVPIPDDVGLLRGPEGVAQVPDPNVERTDTAGAGVAANRQAASRRANLKSDAGTGPARRRPQARRSAGTEPSPPASGREARPPATPPPQRSTASVPTPASVPEEVKVPPAQTAPGSGSTAPDSDSSAAAPGSAAPTDTRPVTAVQPARVVAPRPRYPDDGSEEFAPG